MELNEENVLGIAEPAFARSIEEGLTADFGQSREILLEEWQKRSLVRRFGEWVCKILIEQY
jgi:hypothetical protein